MRAEPFTSFSLMKILIFISLLVILKCSVASLNTSQFSDDQICSLVNDPPLSAQLTFEIESREIICNKGVAIKRVGISISKDSGRFLKLKRWNKMFRGKRPLYSTRSGSNIRIDTFGGEKSISIDRNF
jgi:hypothetical protein